MEEVERRFRNCIQMKYNFKHLFSSHSFQYLLYRIFLRFLSLCLRFNLFSTLSHSNLLSIVSSHQEFGPKWMSISKLEKFKRCPIHFRCNGNADCQSLSFYFLIHFFPLSILSLSLSSFIFYFWYSFPSCLSILPPLSFFFWEKISVSLSLSLCSKLLNFVQWN